MYSSTYSAISIFLLKRHFTDSREEEARPSPVLTKKTSGEDGDQSLGGRSPPSDGDQSIREQSAAQRETPAHLQKVHPRHPASTGASVPARTLSEAGGGASQRAWEEQQCALTEGQEQCWLPHSGSALKRALLHPVSEFIALVLLSQQVYL